MVNQKSMMKVGVIIILAIFLLSSGLVSVMYFVDMNTKTAQSDSGSVETGIVAQTGLVQTGN